MRNLTANFWPSARQFAEAVQCPAVCFEERTLKGMLPAVDRLGMPLVTSGQFAYVFKLNPQEGGGPLAVRCFRGFLGDREARYRALDEHLGAHRVAALPRFRYLSKGVLVAGRRFPILVMEWVSGPTLDVYLEEVVTRREVVEHLAAEWLRLMDSLRAARVAHGDLQHGNVIVERGVFRLVDLDGVYVPALEGMRSSEVGHQHYQHPARTADLFSPAVDNFSALVVYLSLVALAERPELWREHHDENLIFTREDFKDPDASALFRKVREAGTEPARLADALARAALSDPAKTPWLLDLVETAGPRLPAWMAAPAGVEVGGRTREVAPGAVAPAVLEPDWARGRRRRPPTVIASNTVQTIFGGKSARPGLVVDPGDIGGNTLMFAKLAFGNSYAYVWGIFLHNTILEEVWAALGVHGFVPPLVCSFVLIAAAFLLYGLARAFYEWDTNPRPAVTGATPPPLFAAPRAAATQAAGPPLFAAPHPIAAVPRPVVGNASLNIYHLPTCVWADRIAARYRAEFDSATSAQQAGYRPCRVCAP